MKYNALILIGLILGTAAAIFYWFFTINEAMGTSADFPLLFIALLLLTVVAVVVGWTKPFEAGALFILFIGVMLTTYRAADAMGEEFLKSLLLGLPFVLAAILLAIGARLGEREAVNE
ncbi:hypothetical protein ACFL2B_01260 [Patescibacteria group bacterium]